MDNWNKSENIPVKLLLSCNLKPGIDEAKSALAFLTHDFADSMRDAGIKLVDVWYTVYGSWPQIRMSFICEDPDSLRSFLRSKEWSDLKQYLVKHTQSLTHKVVLSRKHFQF